MALPTVDSPLNTLAARLREDERFGEWTLVQRGKHHLVFRRGEVAAAFVDARRWSDARARAVNTLKKRAARGEAALIAVGRASTLKVLEEEADGPPFLPLPWPQRGERLSESLILTLEKARAAIFFRELERLRAGRDEALQRIYRLGRRLIGARSVDELAEAVLTYARCETGADGAAFYEVKSRRSDGRLVCRLIRLAADSLPPDALRLDADRFVEAARAGPVGQAALDGKSAAFWNGETEEEEEAPRPVPSFFSENLAEGAPYPILSALVVPIKGRDSRVLAVLEAVDKLPAADAGRGAAEEFAERIGPFSRHDLGALTALSGPTANVLEEIRRRGREERPDGAAGLRRSLAANLSHELSTPLTLIKAPLGALAAGECGPLGADQAELVKTALVQVERLARMVEDLLELTRLETGDEPSDVRLYSLSEFARYMVASREAFAERLGVKLSLYIENEPLEIPFDYDQLERVFSLLLSNALKFTPRGGKVEVRVYDAGDEAAVAFRDTGVGVPPEHLERIFEPFFRVDSSASAEHRGVGLGLAVARRLVERRGGRLYARSEPGRGSLFTFELPRKSPGEAPVPPGNLPAEGAPRGLADFDPADPAREAADPGRKGPTVLVADDSASMRRMMADALGANFRVLTAADGVEVLKTLRSEEADLLVTDVIMPRFNGYEVLREIRSDPQTRHLPVIFLTSGSDRDLISNGARGLVADDYLAKPFSAEDLLARVRLLIYWRLLEKKLASSGGSEAMARIVASAVREIAEPLENAGRVVEQLLKDAREKTGLRARGLAPRLEEVAATLGAARRSLSLFWEDEEAAGEAAPTGLGVFARMLSAFRSGRGEEEPQ